jgi:hypothetical protein
MALIFIGFSPCALCGQTLQEGEDITGLPPSTKKDHPLYPFFDSGFHLKCFEEWGSREEALAIVKEEGEQFRNSPEYREMCKKYGKPGWLGWPDEILG